MWVIKQDCIVNYCIVMSKVNEFMKVQPTFFNPLNLKQRNTKLKVCHISEMLPMTLNNSELKNKHIYVNKLFYVLPIYFGISLNNNNK